MEINHYSSIVERPVDRQYSLKTMENKIEAQARQIAWLEKKLYASKDREGRLVDDLNHAIDLLRDREMLLA